MDTNETKNFNYSQLIETLKIVLKNNDKTYKDLAKELKMSQSGVQKIFTAKDTSISKIAKICDILNVSLGQLIIESNKTKIKRIEFSETQTKFFQKNHGHLFFYWELVCNDYNVKSIKDSFNLTERCVQKYLYDLDKINIIKLKTNGTIDKCTNKSFSIRNNSEIGKILSQYQLNFLNKVLSDDRPKNSYNSFSTSLKMTLESFNKMNDELDKTIFKYVDDASRKKDFTNQKEMIDVSTLIVSAPTKSSDLISIPHLH